LDTDVDILHIKRIYYPDEKVLATGTTSDDEQLLEVVFGLFSHLTKS
jgi:hypothetical protein